MSPSAAFANLRLSMILCGSILSFACTPPSQGLDPAVANELSEASRALEEAAVELREASAELRAAAADLERAREQQGSRPPHQIPPPVPSLPSTDAAPTTTLEGVTCATQTHCTIKKSVFEQIINSPSDLAKQMRIIPSMKDGQPEGFKVYAIRRGSLPHALHIKNGDRFTHVNDVPLTSVEELMKTYQDLRGQSEIKLKYMRDDTPGTLHITLE